jgi:predicted ArsR family transcriptional regulator
LRTVIISDLADYKCISYPAAQRRLRRCKESGLVRSEVDRSVKVQPGHGSPPLIWSLTKKGRQRLAYILEHLG